METQEHQLNDLRDFVNECLDDKDKKVVKGLISYGIGDRRDCVCLFVIYEDKVGGMYTFGNPQKSEFTAEYFFEALKVI
jgi:hypothetical protein